MSSDPLKISTLGFISAISRTILAIATLGLIDAGIIENPDSSGGGSGTPNPTVPWGERPVDYPQYFQKEDNPISPMWASQMAVAAGLI